MKKFLLVIILCVHCQLSFSQSADSLPAKSEDSLVSFLQKLEIENYLDKSLDSFTRDLPSSYQYQLLPSRKLTFLYMVVLRFPDKPYLLIRLYYRQLDFTNPNAIRKRKQLQDLRKEKVKAIEIYNASLCINGCDL